jgi:hypothetical protein
MVTLYHFHKAQSIQVELWQDLTCTFILVQQDFKLEVPNVQREKLESHLKDAQQVVLVKSALEIAKEFAEIK